jgi:hypothetical protein
LFLHNNQLLIATTNSSIVPLKTVEIIIARCPSSIQFERKSEQYLKLTVWKIERFDPYVLQDWLKLFSKLK